MIEIDGSQGEGGGQILRTALSLSLCTGKPFTLSAIRARRPKPGLMRQHLACVQAAQAVSHADVAGSELGSMRLVFTPGRLTAGDHAFGIGTAGSCTLLLQTIWPALMMAGSIPGTAGGTSRITLTGGTHNPMAPPFHFLQRSYAPLLRRLGAASTLVLRRHGFYPSGGGHIDATIEPAVSGLRPFDLVTRSDLRETYAECLNPGLRPAVAQRELASLGEQLGWQANQLHTLSVRSDEGPGNALMATLAFDEVTEVFTQFGERGRSAERVAQALAQDVRQYLASDAALGPHSADQWALPLALAVWSRGTSARYTCSELTEHAVTNFDVISRFLPVRIETSRSGSGWLVTLSPAPPGFS